MVKDDLKDPFEAIPAVLQLPTNGDPLDRFQTSMYLLVTSTPVYVHISWGIFVAVQSAEQHKLDDVTQQVHIKLQEALTLYEAF